MMIMMLVLRSSFFDGVIAEFRMLSPNSATIPRRRNQRHDGSRKCGSLVVNVRYTIMLLRSFSSLDDGERWSLPDPESSAYRVSETDRCVVVVWSRSEREIARSKSLDRSAECVCVCVCGGHRKPAAWTLADVHVSWGLVVRPGRAHPARRNARGEAI
ncbi:hypothetical protein PINS_up022461 [Pythium insidiosum]|nr:hypothetical protein PINS_up022461 [Pythium insidiosum]